MYGESNANEEKKKANAVPSKPVNSSYKPLGISNSYICSFYSWFNSFAILFFFWNNYFLASALVDTTPIVSPFGKSAATTVVTQPTLSPSFASFADMTVCFALRTHYASLLTITFFRFLTFRMQKRKYFRSTCKVN